MTSSLLQTSRSRTSDGRKIDTWHYPMPTGPRLAIDVFMHASTGSMDFEARSTDPILKGARWRDPDLNLLAEKVEGGVQKALDDLLSADWEDAIRVITKPYKLGRDDSRSFGVVMERTAMRANKSRPRDNLGRREVILPNGSKSEIYERHHTDMLDADSEMIRKMRIKTEEGSSVLLVKADGDNRAALDRIEDVLARFTTQLMDRVSPQCAASDPLPTPDELVEMMRKAAAAIEQE